MCTSIKWLNNDEFYFGRTLDNPLNFGETIVITPRNYLFKFSCEPNLEHHYAMIGMAKLENDYPLYAEGMNEHGLCIAALNFPIYAYYPPYMPNKRNVSPYEFIPYILLQCKTVLEARELLKNCNLVDRTFNDELPLPPLHWMISDKKETIVVEPIQGKLEIYDNPFNVLTNSPQFTFHKENLNNYIGLSNKFPSNSFKSLPLQPYGNGMGSMFLPGDFSPTSRFVRATFLLYNALPVKEKMAAISLCFQVLSSVSVLKGTVFTQDNLCDYTIYTCCMDPQEKVFYYKTYDNTQYNAVNLLLENLNSSKLIYYHLIHDTYIHYQNY